MADSAPEATSSARNHLLTATYSSPTNHPFTHAQNLPPPPTDKPRDRTTYLSSLRIATAKMQEVINQELTARMEDDKANGALTIGSGVSKSKVDEAKEEDNYGEEVVEED
ncbi:hypothetical protein B7494_g6011 [Chlorociboria aeruginascens]|nr:hypothetical protein B7494_g6011 [Chlorociboria aeruginascens]